MKIEVDDMIASPVEPNGKLRLTVIITKEKRLYATYPVSPVHPEALFKEFIFHPCVHVSCDLSLNKSS